VNSVYFGLTTPVNSIEEAVFYLGVRQIRQLAMVTPVIEDFQKLAGKAAFPWREFWRHCIGTAIMTREVASSVQAPSEEADYVAGLVHDVGKIVMASAFPEHFTRIYRCSEEEPAELLALETEILGLNHCELGGMYLGNHHLPPFMIESAEFHHEPGRAEAHQGIVAAVQVADLMVRYERIGDSGNRGEVSADEWMHAVGWSILHPCAEDAERSIARASLKRSLERLPIILEGLV
jgi:HD-like signal output (HDOD) protein